MAPMTTSDRVLYHQIHPVKLATDILSAGAALWFFHGHLIVPGLLVSIVPPVAASFWGLRYADLEALRRSAAGKYVKRSMSPSAQGRRLAGFVILCVAAWYGSFILAVFGGALIIHAWTEGLLLRR